MFYTQTQSGAKLMGQRTIYTRVESRVEPGGYADVPVLNLSARDNAALDPKMQDALLHNIARILNDSPPDQKIMVAGQRMGIIRSHNGEALDGKAIIYHQAGDSHASRSRLWITLNEASPDDVRSRVERVLYEDGGLAKALRSIALEGPAQAAKSGASPTRHHP